VDYVDETTGKNYGLISYPNNQIYIGVDYANNVADGERGRKSIRLSSKRVISGNNLVVIDLEHMPSTVGAAGLGQGCSIWPAFWTVGSNWPNSGEIDLIEYVNTDSTVATTLHTNDGCDQSSESASSFSGYWSTSMTGGPNDNCYVYASDQYSNTGCNIVGASNAVGNAFNTNGQKGGVFAMEWTKESEIRAFYFPRNSVPSDLTSHTPNPDSWGLPYARFQIGSNCPSSHFVDHNIVFDNTFCGDWAGAVFGSQCSSSVSCTDFVKWNPSEYREAYWLINYVEVYDSC